MATMVKEKRRDKKRSREKNTTKILPSAANQVPIEDTPSVSRISETSLQEQDVSHTEIGLNEKSTDVEIKELYSNESLCTDVSTQNSTLEHFQDSDREIINVHPVKFQEKKLTDTSVKPAERKEFSESSIGNEYNDLNARLQRIQIPTTAMPLTRKQEISLEAEGAYIREEVGEETVLCSEIKLEESIEAAEGIIQSEVLEDLLPSAPVFEFEEPQADTQCQVEHRMKPEVPKLISMPLEEAIHLYCGREMEEVLTMSEQEKAAVEAGPLSRPDHPLVDLLSTFKCSLIAVERERIQLAKGFTEEGKLRNSLWHVEKKKISHYETCPPCQRRVYFKGAYEVATLQKDKLQVARIRLKGLLKDLQESYCHHLHMALLTYYQIEEFMSEVTQSNKSEIREALSLVLQALKLSDTAPSVLTSALQRWAAALTSSLLDGRDLRQLLFLIHHLFRQTRSVRWAARVIGMQVGDNPARVLAVLDILLTRAGIDAAVECTEGGEPIAVAEIIEEEEKGEGREGSWASGTLHHCTKHSSYLLLLHASILEEVSTSTVEPAHLCCWQKMTADVALPQLDKEEDWEEVDKDGGGGAVSDGTLRERDILALLRAFPLQDLVARIMLLSPADVENWEGRGRTYESWGTWGGGRDVGRACCGVRAVLHVSARAAAAHPRYLRLRIALCRFALAAVHALHALHDHARSSYDKDMELKIQAELEAVFASGLALLDPCDFHRLPAGLLSEHAAKNYCIVQIANLHESTMTRVDSLSIELAPIACDVRVHIVAQAAVDRPQDYDLARIVLDFLFTIGVRRQTRPCPGSCRQAARDALARLLAAHAHLYPSALLLVAETNPVEKLDASSISWLRVDGWRPGPAEVVAVVEDWTRRCPHLLPPLLLHLDYTPHTGLSLESQLCIGSWLCCQASSSLSGEEWWWRALRRLRVHRACWRVPPDAPPPDPVPDNLFAKAYALMASSYGHCVPVICSEGLDALCAVAAGRVSLGVHCLAPVMLCLAPAHDSISLTPRFSELIATIVNAGPSLVQRALGRGGDAGADLLLRLATTQLADVQCGEASALLGRAWVALLWRPPAFELLDLAMLNTPFLIDQHAMTLATAQDAETVEQMCQAMKASGSAPQVSCSSLAAWHRRRELLPGLYPRLLSALYSQHLSAQRIHVDNALKLIGARMNAEELVVYRCAGAVLAAPAHHPAHLQLWRLLMQLYLQRPPADIQNKVPPVGPLFFSGLMKSRTLALLKRRLQDSIAYHNREASSLAEAANQPPKPKVTRAVTSQSRNADKNLLPSISISDLTSESSDSSDVDVDWSERDEGSKTRQSSEECQSLAADAVADNKQLLAYHVGAKKMLSAYAQWLEEGIETTAVPHLADVARFISDIDMGCALRQYGAGRRAAGSPDEPFPLPPPPPPPPRRTASSLPAPAPFDRAITTILSIKCKRRRRSMRRAIKSSVDNVNFKDSRSLLDLVDKHLKDFERLAQEWQSEVSRICGLDEALWRLVGQLRVQRALPEMRVDCPNKCRTLRYRHPHPEWCISLDTQHSIMENRSAALAVMQRLARPRSHIARTAAALLTIARRMPGAGARAACERAWRASGAAAAACPPAASAIAAFFDLLAERWLSGDGAVCASLVSRWCGGALSGLQQAQVRALASPPRLPAHTPELHAALLAARLPPHLAFSCLSKFDMGKWAASVDSQARLEVLATLRQATVRLGADKEMDMVAELLGVQSAAVCGAGELSAHVRAVAAAMAAGAWPAARAAHVATAAQRAAPHVPFDELGHLLRELGVIWWEARAGLKGRKHGKFPAYAPHVAALLHTLQRALVAAALQLSYVPERVAVYLWSSTAEAWGAWVCPHAAPALLPRALEPDAYAPMLRRFHRTIDQLMADCPGSEEHVLNQMFEWAIQMCVAVQGLGETHEARAQAAALLAALGDVAWASCQWLRGNTLQALMQVSQVGDKEVCAWAGRCCRAQAGPAWLRDAPHDALPARLALLLYLFTNSTLQFSDQVLNEATTLAWHMLPEAALEEAIDRFFMEHYSAAVPYHELPQFKVVLAASELACSGTCGVQVLDSSRAKRARGVSSWLRAASAPALVLHVPAYQRALLHVIDAIAPYLENSEGEIEDLLSRAMVILCIEPAAAAALPVWVEYVKSTVRAGACVRASATLTAFQYFAPLADAAVAAYLTTNERGGWADMARLWTHSPWRAAAALCARGRVHAAYAALAAHAQGPRPTDLHDAKAAMLALLAADIHFVENEVMVSVWICAACRFATSCWMEGEEGECRAAATALLRRWAEPARRSLLQIVTLHPDTDRPTHKHRVLCLYALCVVSGGDEACATAFETACASAGLGAGPGGGGGGGVSGWSRGAVPRRLPRLALRLFPSAEPYFRLELDLSPPDPADDPAGE